MDIRKQMQQSLSDHDDYILKTDEELIEIISNFGCGETEFHTADIECLIKEKQQLQQNQAKLIEALDLLKNGLRQSINCYWLKKQPLFGIHHCSGCTFGLICPDSLKKEVCSEEKNS